MTFTEIYHEYKDLVYNLSMQYVQNVEDAEEITQNVFLKVHQKRDSFRRDASIKTWIYKITINQSLDYIKSKKTNKWSLFFQSKSLDNTDYPIFIKDRNHPGIQLEQKEELDRIFDAINQLPDKLKTCLILLKIEQKSMNEVAEIMGISYKAVESLLYRAKQNLNLILKNEGI